MTVSANAVWRVRPSGSNTNGGGFDCSLSSSASGSNGVVSGTNTFTDTTAAAFTSGMTGSAINIQGVGQFKFTFVSSTVGTLTIGSSGTLQPIGANGVQFAWTMGGGQDYSQQNTAQATGTLGTASGTTTFTDAGGAFTSVMVGNALWIASGTGFTTGAYFITAFGSSTSITLDRSPGTGTVAVWAVGGGWADFWTNTTSTGNIVPGNIVYLLGSGTPNPSSYTLDYTFPASTVTFAQGDFTNGHVSFINDPAIPSYKPSPDTTGGMVCVKVQVSSDINMGLNTFSGVWFVSTPSATNVVGQAIGNTEDVIFGCVVDVFGSQGTFFGFGGGPFSIIGCECFSSAVSSGSNSNAFINANGSAYIDSCNFHDLVNSGIAVLAKSSTVLNSIFAKSTSDAIQVQTSNPFTIKNNTIDGNSGHGINLQPNTNNALCILNNIISDQVTAGKDGIFINGGTATQNARIAPFIDYNTFYNNTSNYSSNISPGPHDTALSSTPYVNSSIGNYQLA